MKPAHVSSFDSEAAAHDANRVTHLFSGYLAWKLNLVPDPRNVGSMRISGMIFICGFRFQHPCVSRRKLVRVRSHFQRGARCLEHFL